MMRACRGEPYATCLTLVRAALFAHGLEANPYPLLAELHRLHALAAGNPVYSRQSILHATHIAYGGRPLARNIESMVSQINFLNTNHVTPPMDIP